MGAWDAAKYREKIFLGLGKKRKYTDCTICCGAEVFTGHRAVLAESSPVFASMFDTEMKEGIDHCITLNDVNPAAVKVMMDFIYTGELVIENEDIVDLIAIADCYQLADHM